tara:strand:+ start:734 stop:928 length:195 start_codon:yes stop_codon:yes gene_type:complete
MEHLVVKLVGEEEGTRPKHWPPPLVIPESLDDLIGDNDTPKEFVCPLTFGLMRQPAMTPHGTYL